MLNHLSLSPHSAQGALKARGLGEGTSEPWDGWLLGSFFSRDAGSVLPTESEDGKALVALSARFFYFRLSVEGRTIDMHICLCMGGS